VNLDQVRAFPIVRVALLPALLVGYATAPQGATPLVIWPCLLIFYGLANLALRRPDRLHESIPTFVTIPVLFLAFYYTIFFLPYQLFVLGLFDLGHSVFLRNTFEDESNRAIILATLGVVSFSLGTVALRSRRQLPPAPLPPDVQGRDISRTLAPMVLVAQAALIVTYQVSGWRTAGEGRYTGTTSGGVAAEGISLLILMFSMIAIALLVARLAQRQPIGMLIWLAVAVSAYWGTRILLAGDRNSFFLLAIVAVGGLFTFRFRAARGFLVLMIAAAFVLYGAIEVTRASGNVSLEGLWATITEPAPQSDGADSSFNISTVTVRAGIHSVPSDIDYGYGKYKLIGILGVVPLLRGYLVGDDSGFITSADVLGYVMLGPTASWGVGTTAVSDTYLDFGTVGVVAVMFLVGLFAARVRNLVRERPGSTRVIVIYLTTLALFAELPRYSIDFPVRMLVWTALLLGIAEILSRAGKSSTSKAPKKTTALRAKGRHAQALRPM